MLVPLLIIIGSLVLLFFLLTFIAYYITFYSGNKKLPNMGNVVSGPKYDNYWDEINRNTEHFKTVPYEAVSIRSFDNKRLEGRFYSCPDSQTVTLLFHGYKSRVEVDGSKVVDICLKNGSSVLAVHQRGHGKSDGRSITFGVLESKDCIYWSKYIRERLGVDCKILLMGISMGAATVMMSSNQAIPQVKGIFADCGYSSVEDMLKIGIKKMRLPAGLVYPFLRLSAVIYGGFDPQSSSPKRSLASTSLPITIVHGEGDDFVPCQMGQECYVACTSTDKRLETFPGAGHAISYYYDKERYERLILEMLTKVSNA